MQTKLDRLLEFISPEKTIVETYNRANEAINTFDIHTARIEDWDKFRYCMAEFLRHLDFCVLHLCRPSNVFWEYYWSRCSQVLCKIYRSSGQKAAFEIARTGNEKGFYGVLKAVAMRVADDYSKNEIASKVSVYLNSISYDERLDASGEYISKYGHLLPSELTEGSAGRVHTNFYKVLQEHPQTLHRLHRVGR